MDTTGTVTISLDYFEELKRNSTNWLAHRELAMADDEMRLRAKSRYYSEDGGFSKETTAYLIGELIQRGGGKYADYMTLMQDRIDGLEKQVQTVQDSAVELLTSDMCEMHAEKTKSMSFPEFYEFTKGKCLWCLQEKANRADAEQG